MTAKLSKAAHPFIAGLHDSSRCCSRPPQTPSAAFICYSDRYSGGTWKMRGMMRYRKMWSLSLFAVLLTLAFIGCDLNDPDEPGNLVPMTVDEDTALPSIFVNGTQLHAEAFGDIYNPIIVFLHGGPGSDYRAFISQIGRENASRYCPVRWRHQYVLYAHQR